MRRRRIILATALAAGVLLVADVASVRWPVGVAYIAADGQRSVAIKAGRLRCVWEAGNIEYAPEDRGWSLLTAEDLAR